MSRPLLILMKQLQIFASRRGRKTDESVITIVRFLSLTFGTFGSCLTSTLMELRCCFVLLSYNHVNSVHHFLFLEATTIKQSRVKICRAVRLGFSAECSCCHGGLSASCVHDFLFDLLFISAFYCLLSVIPSCAACSEVILQHWSL